MTKPETEVKNYKYIVRLKTPRTYKTKEGVEKQIDSYWCTELKVSELLPNSLELLQENQSGSKKITLDRLAIESVEEILSSKEE